VTAAIDLGKFSGLLTVRVRRSLHTFWLWQAYTSWDWVYTSRVSKMEMLV